MSYSSEVLADSPLGFWRLGDSSGTTMADSSGNSRAGSYVGSPTLAATGLLVGDSDTAVTFNGSSQYATVAYGSWMDATTALSIKAVIKISSLPTSGGYGTIVARRHGGSALTAQSWQVRVSSSGGLELVLFQGSTATVVAASDVTLSTATTYRITVIYKAGLVRFYVNGIRYQQSTAAPTTINNNTGGLDIGAFANATLSTSEYFNGTIDEVSFHGSVLAAERVAAHDAAALNLSAPPASAIATAAPYARWRADGGAVLADGTAVSTVDDWTDNNRVAAQTTSGSRPVYKAAISPTGLPVLRFDGVDDSLPTIASSSMSALTFVAVVRRDNMSVTHTLFGASANGGMQIRLETDGKQRLVKQQIADIGTSTNATSTTDLQVLIYTFTAATSYAFFIDNVANGGTTTAQTLTGGLTGVLGGRAGASEFFDGDMAEAILFDRVINSTERADITAELTTKWITVPSNVTVDAPVLTATSDLLDPTVSPASNATVSAPLLTAMSDVLDPVVSGGGNVIVDAPVLDAVSDLLDPTLDIVSNIGVDAPLLTGVSDVLDPVVIGGTDASVAAPVLTGTSDVLNPTLVLDSANSAELGIRLGIETSDQAVEFETATADLGIRLGIEISDVVIHAVETVGLGIRLGLRTYTPKAWGEDVRTGRPAPRLDIADRDGTLVATLPKSTLKPLTSGVNVMDRFGFTVDRNDDRARLIQSVAHEAQLWRGNVLMAKGPIGPGRSDDSRTTYDCADPRWHLADGRRRIGRIPKRQLLLNPGFTEGTNGLAHWVGGWDAGSALLAAPEAEVVSESYARSGKALELGGVDKIMRGTQTLETAAVFKGNRPYAWEPLANGFLPGGEAQITAIANTMTGPAPVVHIVGHTADADGGTGQALSERRALAAKAVVLARWPAAVVTTEGKGETEPVDRAHTEAAYRKNRRVVFDFDRNISAVGHRQFYRQWVTVTQPTSLKVPLALTFAADMRIIEWNGAPGDGWAMLIRAKRGSTVVDEATATMDEFTPRVRWRHYEATIEIPADGIATSVDVRLYPPAGSSRWANVGLWPQDQLGFFDVDQALIVKGIVEHVQDETLGHGDLGIGTRTPLTGVPRTREYPYHERMPADTALEWFTSIDKGMDIDYDQDRNQIVTHYPRQGSSSDLALVHGGRRSNVVGYKPLSTSALALASNVIVQADGSGASRPEGYARDGAALGGTLVEAVISAEEETPLAELDEGAASALAASLRARPGWEVTISPDWTTRVLDRIGKGDTVRLVLPDEDVDGRHRLVASEWNPETDILTLTLIEET